MTTRPLLAASDPILDDFAATVGASGPVTVVGGRTCWAVGGPVDTAARAVHAPAGIVGHRPDEMTVTVRAGTTVTDLHDALAVAGQRTSLPERRGGTVGGALAVGHNGLHRLGRGSVRDAVLQVRYVSAEGRLITAGGPTVKNVSGFDLCRLLVGSLGRLGLLAEVILRTQPIAPHAQWVSSPDADPFAARDRLRVASAVLWDGTTTWVHLEGHEADVAAEAAGLAALGTWAAVAGPPPLPPYRRSLPPAALAPLTGTFVAEVGVGIVHQAEPAAPQEPDPVTLMLHDRLYDAYDPERRLNPGRDPLAR